VLIPALRPRTMAPSGGTPGGTLALAPGEATVAATRWGLTPWDSPLPDAVPDLAERLDDVARTVARDPAGKRLLPWSAEDDWDAPKGDGGPSESGLRGPVWAMRPASVARDRAS